MVECFENDHKVNSKCFICNLIIVLLRDDLNTVYMRLLHVSYNQIGIESVGWGESVEIAIGFYGL